MKKILLILTLLLASQSTSAAQDAEILTTIKPVHSLVLNITKGSKLKVDLLVKGTNSPHGYQLKPSQLAQINNAKIIFYIDDTFETFIYKALKSAPKKAEKVALSHALRLNILPLRTGGLWEADEDEKEAQVKISETEGVIVKDMHFFLAPENAKLMAWYITKTLSQQYPDKKEIFAKNYKLLSSKLNALNSTLATELGPLKDKPFIVFHDAFQYFSKEYGLKNLGSITVEPDQPLKPKRIAAIQDKIRNTQVVCVFTEPQFSDKMVQKLIDGTKVKTQSLDPEAIEMEPSADLYFESMEKLADNFKACLE